MPELIDRKALEQFYESGTDPCDTYADITYIRAEHIEAAPTIEAEPIRHGRWIPCSERLPESFIYVLCAGRDGIGILRYIGSKWLDDEAHVYTTNEITHWMPLPEPPKEVQE